MEDETQIDKSNDEPVYEVLNCEPRPVDRNVIAGLTLGTAITLGGFALNNLPVSIVGSLIMGVSGYQLVRVVSKDGEQ